MARKLKVFRTPIGFHDAYVAAPSRKAALLAWGSDADLFARGVAEEVTDGPLTAEPLAHPGKVIRLSRGSKADQIAALPKTPPPRARKPKGAAPPDAPTPAQRKRIAAARTALARAEDGYREKLDAVKAREETLKAERRKIEQARADDLARLRDALDAAEHAAAPARRKT